MDPKNIDMTVAYIAGITSFFSPCLLPLLPSYFVAMTGFTFKELLGLEEKSVKTRMQVSSVLFVLGFACVYSVLGLSSTAIGKLLQMNINIFVRISGGLLIFLGLLQTGLINFEFLQIDYVWNLQRKMTRLGYVSAFLIGLSCALIWIPCVGQILGSILIMASKSDKMLDGFILLLTFSLGLGTPFVLLGFFFPSLFGLLQRHRKFFVYLNKAAGIIMVLFGIVLVLNKYGMLLELFNQTAQSLPFLKR